MKRPTPSDDPDHNFEVEITSLDELERPVHTSSVLLQGTHLAPRVRLWLTILSVVGGILLIFVVLLPVLSSLLPKKASTPPTLHVPPAQIRDVSVQNGIAYITSSDGTLRALRVKNGSLLWQHGVVGEAPLILNDRIYTSYYKQNEQIFQALKASDGTVLWTFKTSLDSSLLLINKGAAYALSPFSSSHRIVIALDSRNGAEIWHYTTNVALSTNLSIQIIQDKIYISVYSASQNQFQNAGLFVLRVSNGSLVWSLKAVDVQSVQSNLVSVAINANVFEVLRADNGHEVGRYNFADGTYWPPTSDGNLFYVQTQGGLLQALRVNGTSAWTYKYLTGIAEFFPEVNGVLYFKTGDGFIVALRTSDGKRLWRIQPTAPLTVSWLSVEGNTVYTFTKVGTGTDETIVALRSGDGSRLWQYKIDMSTSMFFPQIVNGQVFVDSGITVTVLRAKDGTTLWHADLTDSLSQSQSNFGFLTFADNVVLLHSSDSFVEAHQAQTGALLWRYPR